MAKHQELHKASLTAASIRPVAEVEREAEQRIAQLEAQLGQPAQPGDREAAALLAQTVNDFFDRTRKRLVEVSSPRNEEALALFANLGHGGYSSLVLFEKGLWDGFTAERKKGDLLLNLGIPAQLSALLQG